MNAIPGALSNGGGGGGGDAAAAPANPVASGAAGGSGPINSNVRDRQALTWTRMSASGSLPPPRSGAASVVVKGRLYMFGVSFCVFSENISDAYLFNVLHYRDVPRRECPRSVFCSCPSLT